MPQLMRVGKGPNPHPMNAAKVPAIIEVAFTTQWFPKDPYGCGWKFNVPCPIVVLEPLLGAMLSLAHHVTMARLTHCTV